MKPKLFIFTAWVFYLASQRTSDDLWLYCMVYSIVLAVCAYLYNKGNQKANPAGQEAEGKKA